MERRIKQKHTEEWKKALSERMKGNKFRLGQKPSTETKQKMSNSHLNSEKTKLHNQNMKGQHLSSKSEFKKGMTSWNKGLKGYKAGKQHWHWKDGLTSLTVKIRNCFEYRQWRSDIYHRDGFVCQICGGRSGLGKRVPLNADHYPKLFSVIIKEHDIKTLEEALNCEELWDINNGRTLCEKCHSIETKKMYL